MTTGLEPDSVLAGALPGYEDRPQQRAMAAAVARALAGEGPLLVEAGTGTGKTLAYLVPALESGKRVVVSTGTRTLQDQIVNNDLPLLRRAITTPFTVAVLKGISNYVCVRRLRAAGQLFESHELRTVRAWAARTDSGDRAELTEVSDNAAIWREVTTTPESRLGPRCPHHRECFVTRARRLADKAQLIVVNHHLFFADLALRSNAPGARVLPEYDAVIFDEAHQVEEVATEHFGVSASTARLGALAHDARHALRARTADAIVQHVEHCSETLFARIRPRLSGERATIPDDLFADDEIQSAWFAADTALDELGAHTALAASDSSDEDGAEELAAVAHRCKGVRDDLATIAEPATGDAAHVRWAERSARGVFLRASPIDVAPLLRTHLYDVTPTTVFTSATLTTASSFRYARTRLGLGDVDAVADELRVESPFDFATQAMLYVPRDLPDPRADAFAPARCDRIARLLAITSGRAFVLFTSHRALRETVAVLAPTLPFPVLVQGQQARAALLDRFRDTPGAVLFATGTFWEGVDVPGDALSMVIMDKLPFAPPDDPLVAARMRRVEAAGGDAFLDYQVPQAALALKQGFGRLIRRRDDRGIVAILDGRVVTRSYGQTFLATLPTGVPRTDSIDDLARWWRVRSS